MPRVSFFQHHGRRGRIRIVESLTQDRPVANLSETLAPIFANGQARRIGVRNRGASGPTAVIEKDLTAVSDGTTGHNSVLVESTRSSQFKDGSGIQSQDIAWVFNVQIDKRSQTQIGFGSRRKIDADKFFTYERRGHLRMSFHPAGRIIRLKNQTMFLPRHLKDVYD